MNWDRLRNSTVVNLTPHEITVRFENDVMTFPPLQLETDEMWPPYVEVEYHRVSEVCGFHKYGKIENLPPPSNGTIYLVSSTVLNCISANPALSFLRQDIFAPDTSPDSVVRGGDGKIASVTRLLCCPPPAPKIFSYRFYSRIKNIDRKPYVARLIAGHDRVLYRDDGFERFDHHVSRVGDRVHLGDYGIDRIFYDFNCYTGLGNMITVRGRYAARPGDIIEEYFGFPSEPDWYIILYDGEKKLIGDPDNIREDLLREPVSEYLNARISVAELLLRLGR